jgi:hypothetical protein
VHNQVTILFYAKSSPFVSLPKWWPHGLQPSSDHPTYTLIAEAFCEAITSLSGGFSSW